MTERLNTLEAKVRSCLCSSAWQKFPVVAGEKDVELAIPGRSGVCPSVRSKECAVVLVLPQETRPALLSTRASLTSRLAPSSSHAAACLPPFSPPAAQLSFS